MEESKQQGEDICAGFKLRREEGHRFTVLAFKKMLESTPDEVLLILAGDGPMKAEIQQLVLKLGISDRVRFPGWMSRTGCVSLMNEADYFVHHSVTSANGDQEGLPNAIIEAMAMELPVISTYHSGIPELVEQDVNGFLVEERDIDAYALAMKKMLNWSYLERNREKVAELFSLERHTENLLNIYYKLITKSSANELVFGETLL